MIEQTMSFGVVHGSLSLMTTGLHDSEPKSAMTPNRILPTHRFIPPLSPFAGTTQVANRHRVTGTHSSISGGVAQFGMNRGEERGEVRHLLGTVDQQVPAVGDRGLDEAGDRASDRFAQGAESAQRGVAAAEPEAGAHLGAVAGAAHVVDEPTDVERPSGEADARADHCRLFRVGERALVEVELRWTPERNRDVAQATAEIFIDEGDPTDIALSPDLARFVVDWLGPLRVDVRSRMPELVALGLRAVPAEPPIDHRGRHLRHWRTNRDVKRAVFREAETILQ